MTSLWQVLNHMNDAIYTLSNHNALVYHSCILNGNPAEAL